MVALTSGPRDRTAEYGTIDVVPRDEFVRDFGQEYSSGQHVTKLGPTQRGKSTLTKQLLVVCANPDRKALVLHGKIKGRDPVISEMSNELDMRVINTYPPRWKQQRIYPRSAHQNN
jgi:energy-coupling factor transporter ATP-binding protein EcfA2